MLASFAVCGPLPGYLKTCWLRKGCRVGSVPVTGHTPQTPPGTSGQNLTRTLIHHFSSQYVEDPNSMCGTHLEPPHRGPGHSPSNPQGQGRRTQSDWGSCPGGHWEAFLDSQNIKSGKLPKWSCSTDGSEPSVYLRRGSRRFPRTDQLTGNSAPSQGRRYLPPCPAHIRAALVLTLCATSEFRRELCFHVDAFSKN